MLDWRLFCFINHHGLVFGWEGAFHKCAIKIFIVIGIRIILITWVWWNNRTNFFHVELKFLHSLLFSSLQFLCSHAACQVKSFLLFLLLLFVLWSCLISANNFYRLSVYQDICFGTCQVPNKVLHTWPSNRSKQMHLRQADNTRELIQLCVSADEGCSWGWGAEGRSIQICKNGSYYLISGRPNQFTDPVYFVSKILSYWRGGDSNGKNWSQIVRNMSILYALLNPGLVSVEAISLNE